MQKVYLLRLMPVCVGTKSGGDVLVVFRRRGVKFAQSSSQWEQGQYLKKIYQTLLPTRSNETWMKYTPLTLLSQHKLALTARKTLFAL
jgi:hypothetical protein